jgi:hypothetical protein
MVIALWSRAVEGCEPVAASWATAEKGLAPNTLNRRRKIQSLRNVINDHLLILGYDLALRMRIP